MNTKKQPFDWSRNVSEEASKWNHVIYKVTGTKASRRSIVFWSCSVHPDDAPNYFHREDPMLKKLAEDPKVDISQTEIDELLNLYPGEQFYASRMDEYTERYKKTVRTVCCREKLHGNRKKVGFGIYKNLLDERGKHYNTTYTLLISEDDYNGKAVKYPIRCESHQILFDYSMKDLTTITSCPCKECRRDPNHKNTAVEIVKRRNSGRLGQILRHAQRVKAKYNEKCAVTNSTVELQYHHLNGQDFYSTIQLEWEHNGICLCGVIHRDYHYNFLPNHSVIAQEFSKYAFDLSEESSTNTDPTILDTEPDFDINGAEVSRYTFLEYLRFLVFDMKSKNSKYVNVLNETLKSKYRKVGLDSENCIGEIQCNHLETAIESFCQEYKGDNWVFANRNDILFANNPELWEKVDNSWLIQE